jgi:two-component system response regulator
MSSKDKNSAKILIVEDNPGDILLIQEVLGESEGHFNLSITKDGAEAMDYLINKRKEYPLNLPDAVILDLNLPKKNGREILANIRSDEKLKELPVIIFTSSDAEEDIKICQYLNVIKYYKKPIDFDEYVNTIKAIEKSIENIIESKNNSIIH